MTNKILLSLMLSFGALFAQQMDKNIEINNAYIRQMPPMMKMTAAFMDIKNTTDHDMVIVDVSSKIAKNTETHISFMNNNGNMQMKHMPEVILPKHSTTHFKKGAKHIMLMGLTTKLNKGDKHTISITFKDGTKIQHTFTVKKF